MTSCALVLPAFREEQAIGEVVRELASIAPVIVVDDGSGDGTAAAAEEAGAIVVRLPQNRGYGAAIEAGFGEAVARGFRRVVTVDGDGQHDPADVAHAVQAVTEGGYDLVVGIRPRVPRLAERLCVLYGRHALGVSDPLCGLKGYDVRFFEAYGGFDRRHSVGTELMTYALRNDARWSEWPIALRPRVHGSSRFYAGVRANARILRSFWALVRVR